MTQTHVLHTLASQLPGTIEQRDDRIHSAMLLALYGAVHEVVGDTVLPTPFFTINYDERDNRLEFTQDQGIARFPRTGQYSITGLDAILACHARDMPLIEEGPTGCGKTLTTETYLRSLLPDESSVIMSLSHQTFTDSPKAPFERAEMVAGMPRTFIDEKQLRTIAAMYIDELNLGNPNDLIQLSQGRVLVSTGRGIAGIPIPQLTEDGVGYDDEEHLKRLWVSGSQNPPKTRDAAFSGLELTASMKNRFLVLEYPKIVQSARSTLWLVDQQNSHHERFVENFRKRYEELTGQAIPEEELQRDWLSIYAYVLDRQRTEKSIILSTLEFGDALIGVLSGNLSDFYEQEKAIVQQCKELLPRSAASNFSLTDTIGSSEEVQRLNEILNSFDKPLTERDGPHIKVLADIFATVRSLQRAYQSDNPLATYLSRKPFITVEEAAAAATLLTRNKQVRDAADPLTVVNTVLREYVGLLDGLAGDMNLKEYAQFETDDPDIGIKHAIYTSAFRGVQSAEEIVQRMNAYVGKLKNLGNGTDIRKALIAMTVADLATVSGFIVQHEAEIDDYLTKHPQRGEDAWQLLQAKIEKIYDRERRNPTMPSIYKHRLPRIL